MLLNKNYPKCLLKKNMNLRFPYVEKLKTAMLCKYVFQYLFVPFPEFSGKVPDPVTFI
jgi:hypothetical protein